MQYARSSENSELGVWRSDVSGLRKHGLQSSLNFGDWQIFGVGALGEGWRYAPTLSEHSEGSAVHGQQVRTTLESVLSAVRKLGTPISGRSDLS
eukprot:14894519-Alexandrium_andersonii.AAC.1